MCKQAMESVRSSVLMEPRTLGRSEDEASTVNKNLTPKELICMTYYKFHTLKGCKIQISDTISWKKSVLAARNQRYKKKNFLRLAFLLNKQIIGTSGWKWEGRIIPLRLIPLKIIEGNFHLSSNACPNSIIANIRLLN